MELQTTDEELKQERRESETNKSIMIPLLEPVKELLDIHEKELQVFVLTNDTCWSLHIPFYLVNLNDTLVLFQRLEEDQ